MGFDTVVFTQEELISAIESGFGHIVLCDNSFRLPSDRNIHYAALGSVSAYISLTPEEAVSRGISFDGFVPNFCDMKYAFVPRRDESLLLGGGYGGSFVSSYSSYPGSYSSSYTTSYTSFTSAVYGYEYEYEYEIGSFAASYSGSYMSSYRDPYAHIINPFILVNGYGIDLI